VQRAVETMRNIKRIQSAGMDVKDPKFPDFYKAADLLCPLNEFEECLIFEHRPVACRLFDLPPEKRHDILQKLPKILDDLSRQVYFAFTSRFSGSGPLSFLLPEVASGKFVQVFFHQLTMVG
jgi:Fe-S-cluster containining protein